MHQFPQYEGDIAIYQATDGFVYEINHDQLVVVLEGTIQCHWKFPSPISRITCCEELNAGVQAFVLTTDGVLYKLEATYTLVDSKPHELERPAKRVRYTEEGGKKFVVLSVSRDQVLADALAPTVWIQAYRMNDISGCLIYHVDGSLIFWSIQGDCTVISNPVSVDSNHVKADDKVCHLYVPAGPLSGVMHSNKKRVDGVVFGIGNNNIYYKAVDETSEVCIMDHPDTLHSIHPVSRPSTYATGDIVSIVVLTLEGTVTTVYTSENSIKPKICVFCLTLSVTAAISIMDRLYILDDSNKLYRYSFLDKDNYSKGERLVLVANLSNDPPVVDVGLFTCTKGYEPIETKLLAILSDGSLTSIPISETIPAYNEQDLQNQIQSTIQEIEKCRQSQTLLDEAHHFLNSALSEYNMTIHKLQRILDMKSKSKIKPDTKPVFTCNVKPKVLPSSLRTLVPTETLLSIEIHTDISLRWGENWRLCIEMDPCSSVIDEFVASESAPGELLMFPLDDLRTSVKWERDFAVNARLIGLPLYVNISLAFFPFLNSVRDQHESSIDGRILFPVQGIFLDMLCYITAYRSQSNTDFRGTKRTITDTIEGGQAAVDIYGSAMKKHAGIVFPQSILLKLRTSSTSREKSSQLVLLTLLSEGLDSQLLSEIMVEPEKAIFTLPLDRKTPVTITVRQQGSEQHQLHISLECLQPFILLKALQAITMRLSFNIIENVQDMTDEIQNANATLHHDISRVQDLFQSDQARAQDIVDAYSALSQHCQSLDLGTIVLEEIKTT
ncbi:unnamed protein product [Umbelopsis ramanniana]